MGLFDLFKKKPAVPEEKPCQDNEINQDDIWELWEQGKAVSPYAQIMTYESEVNNGGHSQYFFNKANTGKLEAEIKVLYSILPEPLLGNLKRGYEAFAAQEDISDDINDDLFEECDDVFYENESAIIGILDEYAASL